MKRKYLLLAAAAAVLISCAGIDNAMAYFTSYVTAQGSKTIHLGDTTTIEEPKVSEWTKHIVVRSKAGSKPVYVRARAFAGEQYQLDYSSESGKWTQNDDGYYYYSDILAATEEEDAVADELLVHIGNIPEDAEDFNVVVIYESTPVLYDAEGKPYADWSQKVVVEKTEGGQD